MDIGSILILATKNSAETGKPDNIYK